MEKRIRFNKAFKSAKESGARYRVLYGGAGSGKSHYVAGEILLNMLGDGRYRYLVVRKTGKSIRHSVFALLSDLIREYGLDKAFTINKSEMSIKCLSGATLISSGLDDVEKLKSVANINRIWIEEASEIYERDFNQLDLRLRGVSEIGYGITMTFNPISELHWLKRVFFDVGRDNSFILKTTYKDNAFLDEDYKKVLEDMKEQDYQYYRIYALGEWGTLGNVIFSNWEKRDLSGTRMSFDNIYNGLDFGFASDPTAFIRVHRDKTRREIYVFDEMYKREMHIDELALELGSRMNESEIVTCDSADSRSIADLKRYGIKAYGAKKGPGSIEHGIKWLQGHKIIVDEGCVNTIKELSMYKWKEDKDGNVIPVPVGMNDHLMDALRYSVELEIIAGVERKNYSGKGAR